MARRIVTAREQHEMLSPWRLASTVDGDYGHLPRDDQGRIQLWRGVDGGGSHITYVNQPDPEVPHGNSFHFRPPESWDEVEQNHADENWENYGSYWGHEGEAKFYAGDSKHNGGHEPHGAMAVQAWFPREHVHDSEDWQDGIYVLPGTQGEITQAHVYHRGKGWVPLHDAPGRTVTAARMKTASELAKEYVQQLHDEFHDWAKGADWLEGGNPTDTPDYTKPMGGPLTYWGNIEKFFKDRYPESHRGFNMAEEKARPLMDTGYNSWGGGRPYETGQEAIDKYGYDPKQLAAGMMYLHTWSHAQSDQNKWRGDKLPRDISRLNDIFNKRQQMQRNYEQSQGVASGTY